MKTPMPAELKPSSSQVIGDTYIYMQTVSAPLKAKRSYVGKQYYWQLDAKVDVPRDFDLKATNCLVIYIY